MVWFVKSVQRQPTSPALPPPVIVKPIVVEGVEHTKEWLRSTYPRVVVHPGHKDSYTLARGKHGKVLSAKRACDDMAVAIKAEAHSPRVDYERKLHAFVTAHGVPHVVPLLDRANGLKKAYSVLPAAQPIPEKLTLAEARHIMLGVVSGLEALHAIGVYHRDVKRKNILMVGHDAYLVDWGKATAAVDCVHGAVFARSDWRKAARVFGKLLKQTGMGGMARFWHWTLWWSTADVLDAHHMRRHPLLGGSGGWMATHLLCFVPFVGCGLLEAITAKEPVYRIFTVPPLADAPAKA